MLANWFHRRSAASMRLTTTKLALQPPGMSHCGVGFFCVVWSRLFAGLQKVMLYCFASQAFCLVCAASHPTFSLRRVLVFFFAQRLREVKEFCCCGGYGAQLSYLALSRRGHSFLPFWVVWIHCTFACFCAYQYVVRITLSGLGTFALSLLLSVEVCRDWSECFCCVMGSTCSAINPSILSLFSSFTRAQAQYLIFSPPSPPPLR